MPALATTPEIEQIARAGAYFAFSVSGGKDGNIAAIEGNKWLDSIGHDRNRRLIIHADLGVIEWADSSRMCEEVATHVNLPLKVVRHQTHDMIGRWRQRWNLSLARYSRLELVTLISPWSSSSHRFCTSELKTAIITAALVKHVGSDATIVSVLGIRGDESFKRASQPVWQVDKALARTSRNIRGFVWRPLHAWSLTDVWEAHEIHGLRRHEAYTQYGSTRVSCAYCVLASGPDLMASANNPHNINSFRQVVELETSSAFSFQGDRWLGDVQPSLLSERSRELLAIAKARRIERARWESTIPKEMLYVKGWPTYVPSLHQCAILCTVRQRVCEMYSASSPYLTPETIRARYQELYELRRASERKSAERDAKKQARRGAPKPLNPQPTLALAF